MAWSKARTLVQLSFSCRKLVKSQFAVRGVTTKADHFTTQNTSDDILLSNKGEALFAKLTSKELLKTLFNLQLVAYEPLVDLSIKILTSDLIKSPLFRAAVLPVLRRTAYSHFCAGENVEEASRTLARMWELGLRGIMTYGLEDATDCKCCDENLEKFLQIVPQASQLPPESAASDDGSVVLATHNMNSGRAAAAKVQELGLSRGNPRVQFGQLKGMADVLSLSLVNAGFRVSKVLPFGSVSDFIPFILRRAEENRGLLGNTIVDRQFLRAELTRRLPKSFTM